MSDRIHMVVERREKERFRRSAAREGKSLSEWLREAAHEKARAGENDTGLDTPAALRDFFERCDERERGREPDWEEHRAVIERSKGSGASAT